MEPKRQKHEMRLKSDPRDWLERAQRDVDLAKIGKGRAKYRECVLLCQRGVEKALTAFLMGRGLAFGLTHDLGLLFRTAQEDAIDLQRFAADVAWLGAYQPVMPSVDLKPPEQLPAASALDLDRALMVAEPLVAWARAQLDAR